MLSVLYGPSWERTIPLSILFLFSFMICIIVIVDISVNKQNKIKQICGFLIQIHWKDYILEIIW